MNKLPLLLLDLLNKYFIIFSSSIYTKEIQAKSLSVKRNYTVIADSLLSAFDYKVYVTGNRPRNGSEKTYQRKFQMRKYNF